MKKHVDCTCSWSPCHHDQLLDSLKTPAFDEDKERELCKAAWLEESVQAGPLVDFTSGWLAYAKSRAQQ